MSAPLGHALPIPWVKLRSAASGWHLFKRMIAEADPRAKPGDVVAVYDKSGAPFGAALYNPKSLIGLRLLQRGLAGFDLDAFLAARIDQAVAFRREVLRLDEHSDAYRLVHDIGDGLPGLAVDRYGDHIALEFYSLGMVRLAPRLEWQLKRHFPSARFVHRASPHVETMEGFKLKRSERAKVKVKENGVIFEVDLGGGRKTGFFCDQRDNRFSAAQLARGRSVLDVCSYTGGFGIYAKKIGGAQDVTCVELDAESCAQAERNANLNQVRISVAQADAFGYLRQMAENKKQFGLVILDPYKLIASQEGWGEGRGKYLDLNRLAFSVVEPGGFLVTCSCSGLLPWDQFQQFVRTAAGSARRQAQIFKKSGAGADHPFAADHPEGEYLKALWCRVT